MRTKNLIAITVGAACAWPILAAAGPGAAGAGHWEVMTPSSVSESAPWLAGPHPHLAGWSPPAALDHRAASAAAEALTPLSVDESAPWLTAEQKRERAAAPRAVLASLPNPRTPASPNESGVNHYGEEHAAHAAHVASVEQARIAAAASHVEVVAQAPAEGTANPVSPNAADAPEPPREREHVAVASPALVDSRNAGMSAEPDRGAPAPAGAGPDAPAAREPEREAALAPLPAEVAVRDGASGEPPVGATGGAVQSEAQGRAPM